MNRILKKTKSLNCKIFNIEILKRLQKIKEKKNENCIQVPNTL